MKLEDLTGRKFNRLTVLSRTEKRGGNAQWNCVCSCGSMTQTRGNKLKSGATKSCGCFSREQTKEMRGERHPNWNGGVYYNRKGYRMIRRSDHPAQQNGYVHEHRLVMERILGRFLLPQETVHHKNGNRKDNRPENLELWTKAHSYGQRASDLVEWAIDILSQYAPEKLNPNTTTAGLFVRINGATVGPLS